MMQRKILAIIGSYRENGITEQAVDEILAAAASADVECRKIHLAKEAIEFCRNCRSCTQEPGKERGRCVIHDRMGAILDEIEACDGLILAAPVNIGDVTAVTRRFYERLICYSYWPWGQAAPKPRRRTLDKAAVLVTSAAMPAVMAWWFTRARGSLRRMARLLGARSVGSLTIGLAARQAEQRLGARDRRHARALGARLHEAIQA